MTEKNNLGWITLVVVISILLIGLMSYQVYDIGIRIGETKGNQTGYEEGFALGRDYGAITLVDYMYQNNATITYQDKLCGCFDYGGN